MSLVRLTLRNASRAPARGALTVLAAAVTLVAFVLLRTLSAGWTDRIEQTPNDRVVTRHKIGWASTMPVHYTNMVRGMPGVKVATGARWAGLKLPTDDSVFFGSVAVDARSFVDAERGRERAYYEKVSEGLSRSVTALGDLVTLIFACGAMLGAAITMNGAIAQRRREIGVLRALGFSPSQVLLAFLLESTALALAGALLGALLASLLSFTHFSATNYGTGNEIAFPFEPSAAVLLRSVAAGAFVGVLGGFFLRSKPRAPTPQPPCGPEPVPIRAGPQPHGAVRNLGAPIRWGRSDAAQTPLTTVVAFHFCRTPDRRSAQLRRCPRFQ